MQGQSGALALLLILAGVSASLGVVGQADPGYRIDDPEGDATEWNTDLVTGEGGTEVCRRSPDPNRTEGVCNDLRSQEREGGTPAPPSMDLLGFELRPGTDALTVRLELADLDQAFTGAVDQERSEGVIYGVYWHVGPDCVAGAYIEVVPLHNGPDLMSLFSRTEGCREDGARWSVPYDLSYQAASITWTVPLELLPASDEGLVLQEPTGRVHRTTGGWGNFLRFQAAEPTETTSPVHQTMGAIHLVDATDQGQTLRLDAGPYPELRSVGSWEDPRLPVLGDPPHPEGEIIGVAIEETPTSLTFNVTLAHVPAAPTKNAQLILFADLPSGQRIRAGANPSEGRWIPGAALGAGEPDERPMPVDLEVRPGAPGSLVLRFLRSDLGSLQAGDLLHRVFIDMYKSNQTQQSAGQARAFVLAGEGNYDNTFAPPYRFRFDTSNGTLSEVTAFEDAAGDVVLPTDVPEATVDPRRFDLAAAEVLATAPDELRLTVRVAGAPPTDLPVGYDAMLYGAALETVQGRTMIGWYKARGDATGQGFCAQDVTVLTQPRQDPTAAAWNTIEAVVSGGGSAEPGETGASRGAVISFYVPLSCLGLEPGDPVPVSRLRGATFLVRNPTSQAGQGQVTDPLDTLDNDEPFTIETAAGASSPPFWSKPFGVENFWDILGIAAAALTTLVTAALILHRRRAMGRYLAELDRIEDRHEDPDARARALVALRERLHRDLVRHRISENHYPIVADRLRARLTSARINSLGETFYALPGPLSRRLERLIDDGRLSPQDHAALAKAVEGAGLGEDVRGRLVEHLDAWVAQDGGRGVHG